MYPRSWRVRQSEATTDLAQKALRLPRFDQHLLHVSHTRQLKNEAAAKTGPLQFGQYSAPVYVAFTRRQMLITVAVIVVGVDHSQMPAQLVHDAVNVTGQISMAGIETDTHLRGIHCSQNPEQVARVRKQQVWKFIFQDASDPELTATLSDLIQRVRGPSQSLEPVRRALSNPNSQVQGGLRNIWAM